MRNRITVDIPGASPEVQAQAVAWLEKYFADRGITPWEAAVSGFNRETGHIQGTYLEYDNEAADLWTGVSEAVCTALGLERCNVILVE